MKQLLLVLLGLTLATGASAQTIEGTSHPVGGEATTWSQPVAAPHAPSAAAPLAETIKLSYYDESKPAVSIQAPSIYGNTAVILFGQRFTLPTASGYVDSVRIHLDSVYGDKLLIVLMKDTLYTLTNGARFHLIDIYNPGTSVYGVVELSLAGLTGLRNFWVTVPFPHVAVPKEFFVNVQGSQISPTEFTSGYFLTGEAQPNQGPTEEGSRSAFVGSTDPSLQTYFPGVVDGFFTSSGSPLGVDFHIDAFVEVSSSSVSSKTNSPASVYPNPVIANASLRISHDELISSISVRNMLGAEVSTWGGMSSQVELPTVGLAKGVYQLLITTESGVTTEKIVVN